MLTDVLTAAQDLVQAAPSPTPTESPIGESILNSSGIVKFILSIVVPPIVAVLGVVIVSRAFKGEVSKVMTSSAIVLIGIVMIAAAPILFFAGPPLVDLVFAK